MNRWSRSAFRESLNIGGFASLRGETPVDLIGFIDTTEVVPLHKATARLDN